MRYINLRRFVHRYAVATVIAFFTGQGVCAESLIQFDGRAAYATMQALPYVAPASNGGLLVNTNLYTIRSFTDSLSLIFNHRLYAGDREPVFPEQIHPVVNYLYLGLRLQGLGIWQAGASDDLYPFSQPLPMPYYLPDYSVTPQMLNAVDGSWNYIFLDDHANERARFRAMTTYFDYNYELKSLNPVATDPLVSESPPYGSKHDVDLWTDLSGGYNISKEITLNAGSFLKSDLSTYNGYDINHYWAGLSGDDKFSRGRLILSWDARERFLQSPVMSSDGYADGWATDVALRFLWRKRYDFFIKGITHVEIGDRLHKQLYEAMLRKTWKSGSSFDLSYYATSGVLFPRHSFRVATVHRLSDHFGIAPSIEGYISRLFLETAFRYYRTDMTLEFLFPLTDRLESFAGAGYSYYDRHPLFSPRATFYSGLRTW